MRILGTGRQAAAVTDLTVTPAVYLPTEPQDITARGFLDEGNRPWLQRGHDRALEAR